MSATADLVGAWINGRERLGDHVAPVTDPYRGVVAARVAWAGTDLVAEAVEAATAAAPAMAAMASHRRAALLRRAADLLAERSEEFADGITRQTGKVLADTRREAARSPVVLRAAATAAEQLQAALPPADAVPLGEGTLAFARREPVGVVAAITPFNAPLNLVVHKVAPALAAGNAVVVKPAPAAPLTALALARLLEEAGFPAGAVNVVPGGAEEALALAGHDQVDLVSFTGGTVAGAAIQQAAGLRRVLLELGGNSPNLVHHDADLAAAADECIRGGFANGGQSCNSVQRILVHEQVRDEFLGLLVAGVRALPVGDPSDPDTRVGPVVSEESAARVLDRLASARAAGATIAVGGRRDGALVDPAVVVDAPFGCDLYRHEVFAPVVLVNTYGTLDEAIERANELGPALQAAVFTASLDVALAVSRRLRAGGVIVNRSSNFRLDHLPYGGLAAGAASNGIGREGSAFAVEEMSELHLTVLTPSRPSGAGA